jgi:hypothetical protein
VIEQNKRRQQRIDKDVEGADNEQTSENDLQKQKNVINSKTTEYEPSVSEEQKEDGVLMQGKNIQNAKYLRNNKKSTTDNIETKQMVEKLLAAKEEIARRHAETIGELWERRNRRSVNIF